MAELCMLGPPLVGCGQKIVLHGSRSNVITCLTGGHVLEEDMSSKGHVLLEYMSNNRSCLIVGYVLWKDMSYKITYITRLYVLL